jgi:hypothetical protein
MKHELFITNEAITYFAKTNKTAKDLEADMATIANNICELKGWRIGLNCMLVLRDGRNGRTPYFVINQVLDSQTRVVSTRDLNFNTPSFNADTHCIMTMKGNGPNKYAGFERLLTNTRTGKLKTRIV